jgi:hypothetical protein
VFDPLKVYPGELRTMLGAGESPVAAAMCREAFGADRVERTPEEMERAFRLLPRPVRERLVAATQAEPAAQAPWDRLIDVLTGTTQLLDPDDATLFGVTASGHVGSLAARLLEALRVREPVYCVVSDRRLVLARHHLSPASFEEVAAVPLWTVLAARRAGTLLHRGRVVLDLADLSQLAVMTGIVFTSAADRLVAAINRGRAADPGP